MGICQWLLLFFSFLFFALILGGNKKKSLVIPGLTKRNESKVRMMPARKESKPLNCALSIFFSVASGDLLPHRGAP